MEYDIIESLWPRVGGVAIAFLIILLPLFLII